MAVTPACGTIGPMGAILLGVIVSVVCYFFVTSVKHKMGYDDSLDVFGIHGIGGIIGAVLTGVFSAAAFGGVKGDDYAMMSQLWVRSRAWSSPSSGRVWCPTSPTSWSI